MKRIIFVFLYLISNCIHAQETNYRPFIEEGKVWYLTGSNSYIKQYIGGDTVVAGKSCKKWMQQEPFYNDEMDFLAVYVYEKDKQVWFFYDGDTTPRLMFDFGVERGDTLIVWQPNAHSYKKVMEYEEWRNDYFPRLFTDTLVIRDISFAYEYGRFQRKIHYSGKTAQSASWECLFEGIGSPTNPNMNLGIGGTIKHLIACFVNNEVLYLDTGLSNYWSIPLPTSITAPSTLNPKPSTPNTWYDLSGHRLTTPPTQKGIYIRDGKKVLIK